MAKQSQPKVSELVEVLIEQMTQFEKAITERNQVLSDSISKLKYMKVDFNIKELEAMKQSNRDILQDDFENFHIETRKNNNVLLRIHKKVSSKRLLYLVILNFFFLSTAVLSTYVAVRNSIEKSKYSVVLEERDNLKKFLFESPKDVFEYQNWLQK